MRKIAFDKILQFLNLKSDAATFERLNLVTFNKFWLGFQQFGHIFVVSNLVAGIKQEKLY